MSEKLKSFWHYQVRYRLGRELVHLGLRVMPKGEARQELTAAFTAWSLKVYAVSAARAALAEPRQ